MIKDNKLYCNKCKKYMKTPESLKCANGEIMKGVRFKVLNGKILFHPTWIDEFHGRHYCKSCKITASI